MNHTIKNEDSSQSQPATEALELLLQNEDNILLDDLTELLKRDPTLSSLKAESDNLLRCEENSMGGMPIPHPNMIHSSAGQGGMGMADFEDALSEPPTTASSFGATAFGTGSSSLASNASPSMFTSAPVRGIISQPGGQQHQQQMMDTSSAQQVGSQSTLAALNGGGEDSNSLMKLELNPLADVDINDFFTNDSSKNVSFGVPYKPVVKTEPTFGPTSQPQQQMQPNSSGGNFWHTEPDSLFFGTTSFTSQSGGVATTSSKDLLSSSVPGSIFPNSPLGDILSDLNPSPNPPQVPSPSVSPNLPSHAGPERHSTLHKLLLRKDPVSRPSPVRSPENRKTLEKLKSSLSASNPLLCQQLSK
jgi:hypothetical protein